MSRPPSELQRVAVVGAGTSGRGMARSLAAAGLDVLLVEKSPEALERSMEALRQGMERDIGRWSLTGPERDAALARIEGATGMPDLAGIELLLEAIPEDRKEKSLLLKELDRRAPVSCVFLLNTSTLSITELSEELSEARRPLVIGLHFLHPVTRIPLVELVRGKHTGEEAERIARALAQRLGKEVMEASEYPGYVTTRLTLGLINEAVHLVMEGVATRDTVDRAMKLRLGSRHGPLALADEIGLDSVHRALTSLWRELGLPQYRPAPLLRRMVSAGWLGEKAGRGFYRYEENGQRITTGPEDLSEPSLESFLRP